jgi:hypothetical protein
MTAIHITAKTRLQATACATGAALLLNALHTTASADASIGAMAWQRRIIVMSAAQREDANLEQQRRLLAAWSGGEERDDAASLRRHFHLPSDAFTVILVGKDGHVALRSPTPVTGAAFQQAIDAMPMRKAGER